MEPYEAYYDGLYNSDAYHAHFEANRIGFYDLYSSGWSLAVWAYGAYNEGCALGYYDAHFESQRLSVNKIVDSDIESS